MEYFQIVDINGKPTGDIISIDELKKNHGVPPEGTYLQVVKVVIVNGKDQVLLQKRSETKPVNPGVWGLCGGKVNLEENPIDTACRETSEEIGIDLDKDKLEYLCSYHNEKSVFSIYLIQKDVDINACKIQADEVERLDYFDLDQLKSIETEGLQWLENLRRRLSKGKKMDNAIRKATKDDADAWAEIIHNSAVQTYSQIMSSEYIAQHYNILALKEQFLRELVACDNGDNSCEHYIICCNGEPAGILKLGQPVARYSDGNNYYRDDINGFGEIKSLHIADKFKRSGVGAQAIQFAENRLRELGYSVSHIWVKQGNPNAIEFYKHLGYEITPYVNPNTNDKAPSVVMEKSLIKENVAPVQTTEIEEERY